jgi:hypothetical protein
VPGWGRCWREERPKLTEGGRCLRRQSEDTTTRMVSAGAPLSWSVKGCAARSNLTLLRRPAQPTAPLKAEDFTACPFCTTSIHDSEDSVILYVAALGGVATWTNPAKDAGDFGAGSGGKGNLASAKVFRPIAAANGIGQGMRSPELTLGKSVPLSVARSLSSGHLNLSQPDDS